MQIGILEPKGFSEVALKELKEIGEVIFFDGENINDFLRDKDVLFVRLNYYLDESIFTFANNLKFLCSPTTGLNHINLSDAKNRGIQIISLKNESRFLSDIRATSEHTIGLIFALLRNHKAAFHEKSKFNRDLYKGYEIFNNEIGIIGYGRIGKLLSKYINALGGKVFYYDTDLTIEDITAKRVGSLTTLIEKCNVICLCASFTGDNRRFITKDVLNKMKGKFFINTSRGELIDEEYLIKMIKNDHFKGVAIDVITNESEGNNRLNEFQELKSKHNFILTPHIGGATYTSMERTEVFITKKLKQELYN